MHVCNIIGAVLQLANAQCWALEQVIWLACGFGFLLEWIENDALLHLFPTNFESQPYGIFFGLCTLINMHTSHLSFQIIV
jgi:hypothetical protein